ncbi:MAG: ABC transporter permease [Deltaproteobacteria bacterium]|nr:ABC transporter permease [Deltaproteobacteria bacterium]MBN2671032.1 ABC transporter permease [Deltaproteobacteria bacterium]
MGAHDISTFGLVLAACSLLASVTVYAITKVGLTRDLFISMGRMGVQLSLVGVYLTGLFRLNHPAVTVGYIFLMMAAANYSVLKNTGLKRTMFFFTFPATIVSVGAVSVYFMTLVFQPNPLYDARYLIPIMGMLLGNSMNRTIVTMERFYSSVRKDESGYSALVAMGATVNEATAANLKVAYRAGLGPALANLATMGIVSLPGMMTGQILGGSDPLVAIKYQVAIILAIYVATDLSALLCITFSKKKGFTRYGFLNHEIFKK